MYIYIYKYIYILAVNRAPTDFPASSCGRLKWCLASLGKHSLASLGKHNLASLGKYNLASLGKNACQKWSP